MHEPDIHAIVDEIATRGWSVCPEFLHRETVSRLRAQCLDRHAAGAFHPAGVGAGKASLVSEIRGDAIHWLEADDPDPAVQEYLRMAEDLRVTINRDLFLGLGELEAHFAAFPPGAYYRKHLDRFRDDDRRVLTAIVYLNEDWADMDGGALRFWSDPSGEGEYRDIPPTGGTLVTFLSGLYWHAVLPARRQRLALTGWFKRRQQTTGC